MAERLSSIGEKLVGALGNIVPEDHKEDLRKRAEAVLEKGMEGFDQLRADVENMAKKTKKLTEDVVANIEEAFAQFRTEAELIH